MKGGFQPRILGFLCNWCCYTAADSAGVGRYQYPPNLRVIRMMCTGRLDPFFPLEGFARGADGVFVGGCHLGECHYQDGNYHALITAAFVKEALAAAGINPDRFIIDWASAAEGPRFVKLITDFTQKIASFGPLGEAENEDENTLRLRALKLSEAARGKKLRSAILNAAKVIVKEGNYEESYLRSVIHEKCAKMFKLLLSA